MNINDTNRETIKAKIIMSPHCCVFPWAIQFVIDTVKTLPPGSIILEMGTFVGGTTRLFAQANPNITIHTIDIDTFGDTIINPDFGHFAENPMIVTIQETYGLLGISVEDVLEIRKLHIEDYPNIISHLGNSTDLKLENIDLVFVDASHTYEDVLNDLRYAWGIVKDGGYIFGDDVHSAPLYNALWQFCQEVDTSYTVYSKCFKIEKKSNGNGELRKQIESLSFIDFQHVPK